MGAEVGATLFAERAPILFEQDIRLDFSDESIHRLSQALTPKRRDAWASMGQKGTSDNELFNIVIHASAYVGSCIVRNHQGSWSIRRPLWESLVRLVSYAGEAELPIFHWLIKSLADPEEQVSPTLADRYRTYVEVPCSPPLTFPIFLPHERSFPRLSRVKYDLFYKYLKAHLPELRDLGKDFPTIERFDAYDFKWLEMKRLGDGQMILLYGLGKGGLQLFWLDSQGFHKSLWIECDAFPDPVLKIIENKLQVHFSSNGKHVVHEMLWWGM